MDPSLAEALAGAWALLARAAADRRHPARVVQLATCGLDGAPALRSVILRGADAGAWTLRLHTDRRSAKVAEIAADPRVALVVWDPRSRVQLRLAGRAERITGGAAWHVAWLGTSPAARRDYAAPAAPGTPAAGLDATLAVDPAENFVVLSVAVQRLDWLRLAPRGHLRAGFSREAQAVRGTWLVP